MLLDWRQLKSFLNRVIVTMDDDDCWEWQGRLNDGGYGCVEFKDVASLAHRIAWVIHTGELVPKGMGVLHNCDNPRCVNPNHLKLGTQLENMQDMAERGRYLPRNGEDNPNSRLTNDDVKDIKAMLAKGIKRKKAARKYRVSLSTIDRIVSGLSWGHINPEIEDDIAIKTVVDREDDEDDEPAPPKKSTGRGRPAGSKNKKK